MADRTQLRAADRNDIADDDPFAELTRIMGFDPRQPVKPQASVQPLAGVDHRIDEADFDIDLEKELMGDFGDSEAASIVHLHEPTFEASDTVDDELAMSLDEDFHLDAADIAGHGADQTAYAAVHAPEPTIEAAFDDDFDNAVASSLEDVSPFEDDQPMEDELAASFEQNFQLDSIAVDHAEHFAQAAPAIEPAFDHEFDHAVANSLEDELMFDDSLATQDHQSAPMAEYRSPVTADAYQPQAISDEDFAGHFDDAMADAGIDFDQPAHLSVSMIEELDALDVHAVPVATRDETVALASKEAFDHDFDLNFDDALAEEAHEPLAQVAAAAVQPAVAIPVVQPVQAPVESERSLEDELNALLGAMSARTAPVAANEPVVQQPVVEHPVAVAEHAAEEPADLVGDLDWDLDDHAAAQTQQHQAVQPVTADLDTLLLDELQGHDFAAEDAVGDDVVNVDFDNDAFDAAFARSIGLGDERADNEKSNTSRSATPSNAVDSMDWLAERSTPPEPARQWSRVTPVAQPAVASSVASSLAPVAAVAAAPAMMAASAYRPEPVRSEPVRSEPVRSEPVYAAPTPVQQEQPARYDEMPDVETVDVPERVVALADDLDIPELHFEEDEPASAGYDDLDSEFASLLSEMNTMEVPAAAPARSPAYDDESYNAGFKPGYEQTTQGYAQAKPGYDQAKPGYGQAKPGYSQDRVEARTYAARPAEVPAAASYADAAGFDVNELPGSQPVSQADDFTVDELDYDPELDEAMAVPGLAAQENARQPRRRGLFIAAIVGGVAIAGGLGAFALSSGKGSGGAPVIVKADNAPIKVKPENPGGTVVPNQDNKVYDAVLKGAKPAEQVQQKLVTNTEQPVDVAAKDQQTRVVDLSADQTDAAAGTAAAGNPDAAAAPAPKSEDRIAQVLQDADKGTNTDVVAVAPRKVRTMVVKADGSLVARDDPAPAAQQVAAAEPTDPAPQRVAPSAQDDSQATGAVPAADDTKPASALKPVSVPKAEAKAQSANTPAKVPVAPQRPSDQPVDVVGEVKPDQVASIDPAAAAAGGSWSIQIASQPTVESAQSTYQDLQRRYGSVLGGRTANIVKAEIAGKGTFYRVRVPAQSRNDAINLCTSYKAAGGNCFVSR